MNNECLMGNKDMNYKMLHEFFNNIPCGVAVYEARDDANDFIFKDFNKAAELIDHVHKKDLIGKSVLEMYPGIHEFGLFNVLQKVYRTGKTMEHPVTLYKDKRMSGWRKNHVFKLSSGEIVAIFEDITSKKQTNRIILQSQSRIELLNTLINESSDEFYIINPSTGQFIDVNDATCKRLGFSKSELLNMKVSDIEAVLPDDFSWNHHAQILKKARYLVTEGLHRCKDNSTYPVEVTLTYYNKNNEEYFLAFVKDITERKLYENKLKNLARFTDENPNPVLRVSDDFCILYKNKACDTLFNKMNEKEKKKFMLVLEKNVKILTANRHIDIEYEFRNKIYLLSMILIPELKYINIYFSDITESKQAEKTFTSIMDSVLTGIILVETSSRKIFYVNPYASSLIGLPSDKIIGNVCHTFICPNDADECPVLDHGIHVENMEKVLITSDKKEIPILKTAIKISIFNNEFLLENFIDIRSLREKENKINAIQQQLVHSEKMASIGQLAAGVAHEINNPVGFVMSNLSTLKEYMHTIKSIFKKYFELSEFISADNYDTVKEKIKILNKYMKNNDLDFILEDLDQLVEESYEGTERIKDIVQSLKSFARIDEGESKETDINQCIETTLKIVWNELKYKCKVNKNFGKIPFIQANPAQLNQVFLNLFMNASQAISDKGDINITTESDGSHVIIRISDTGKGIPEKNISKLFDPFFTTKPVGMGTGLGLSISYGIIKNHNGTILVESKEGKGTTFIIKLPVLN